MALQQIRFRVAWHIYNPGDIAAFSPAMVRRLTSPILIHGQPPAPPVADRYYHEAIDAPVKQTVEDIARNRIIDEETAVVKVPIEEPKAPAARKPRGGGRRRDGTPKW